MVEKRLAELGLNNGQSSDNMQIKGIESENLSARDMKKEDRKDERIDKQSTQQSTMIQQRKDNTPPVNFESNEDTLDGFGLESFG